MNFPEGMIDGLKDKSADNIGAFIDLCRELVVLVKDENDLILATGTGVTEGGFHHKIALMSSFEERTVQIFELVKEEAPQNKWLHLFLMGEISILRHIFKINTALHLDDLQRRAKRLSVIKDGILASVDEGAPPCH